MSTIPKNLAGWFDSIRADYDATKQSRFIRRRTGVAPLGGSGDYHFRSEIKYYDLIEQARDMDRNDGLVGTLADRRVDNIVQQGFTLDTGTGDKGLDLELWNRWQAFANDPERCDIAGELCWHEIERLVCRAESIDGDIVVLGTEEGSFQTIEAHAIQTSSRVENTFLGVTRNLYGRREQYHVRYDINEFAQKTPSIPIDVRNADGLRQLFHVYNPKRVSITRGVTQLAPVFALSGMLEDINFAKLVQQQIVSCFAIFRKMAANSDELPSVAGIYGEAGQEVNPAGTRQLEGISPGMEIVGRAGEELQGFSPNVPNSEYFQQVKLILQVIGVNFGLPLCLVLMDGSETNFSGWRGAVDEARKGFVADQSNLVRRLHTPAYLWWLNREISLDNSLKKASRRDGINIEGHKWNLPTWSYIEPVADAEGDLKQLQGALTSPRRMHAARGKDWEEISEEIIADNFYAISRAQKQAEALNKQFPNGPMLTWRDLIPLPMQAGATLAMQDPAAVKQEDEESDAPPKKPAAKGKRNPVASEFDESKKKAVGQSESRQETELMAEILLHVYGDDAESLLFDEDVLAAFDEAKIKRDEKGRFATKGSAASVKAAKSALAKALTQPRTKKSAQALSDKLEMLTVKQLTDLKKEYGIKASGRTKQQLIDKLADRLDRGRRNPAVKKKAAKKKTPNKKREAERRAAERKKDTETQNKTIDDQAWTQATREQQQQMFRESLIQEISSTAAALKQADSVYFSAVQKETNVVLDIDQQTMRLARAEQRLAENADDTKAQNEARIAKERLVKLEAKLIPAKSAMRIAREEQNKAVEQHNTAVTRMMGDYISRVNGTEQKQQEEADKLAEIKQLHQSNEQIIRGKLFAQTFFSATAHEESLQIASSPTVIAERQKGQQLLTGLTNARFHAEAISKPIIYQKGIRASASQAGYVALSDSSAARTYIHEYGHQIEFENRKAKKLVSEFLDKRVKGEPLQSFSEKFPESNYDDSEFGRKDDFVKTIQAVYKTTEKASERRAYYIGKVYMSGVTEVLSMGIELLAKNASAFAKADPEYFDLVVGILSGHLLED